MKKYSILLAVILLATLIVAQDVSAQIPYSLLLPSVRAPRLSQGAKVSQVIGLSEVTIFYHRPGVKGRKIWGDVVKYNEPWRVGANEPTLIQFSDEVTIEGKKLPAGTYRLLMFPGEKEWSVVLNAEVKSWGTVYDAKYDTLRFAVKPESGPNEEWLSLSFEDLTPASAKIVMAWEKVRIAFKIEFNLLAKLQASVGTAGVLNQAARFAVDNKLYYKEAMGWVDRSIAIDKNAGNLRTKAELLALDGKNAEALASAEEALSLAKARNQQTMLPVLEKLITDLKAKK
ncbi:MAG: DUF2911 domain-containing protein [bacterium]